MAGMAERRQPVDWNRESIRELRRHMGLTQAELARLLGIRQQTVSEWEGGLYKPRGATVTLLNIVADRSGFKYQAKEE